METPSGRAPRLTRPDIPRREREPPRYSRSPVRLKAGAGAPRPRLRVGSSTSQHPPRLNLDSAFAFVM